jgi:hypothetical protein
MYDYNNGRFLSVDPFIQAPTSTQSMNPYTYIFNNPLSGIDPTGYVSDVEDDAKFEGGQGFSLKDGVFTININSIAGVSGSNGIEKINNVIKGVDKFISNLRGKIAKDTLKNIQKDGEINGSLESWVLGELLSFRKHAVEYKRLTEISCKTGCDDVGTIPPGLINHFQKIAETIAIVGTMGFGRVGGGLAGRSGSGRLIGGSTSKTRVGTARSATQAGSKELTPFYPSNNGFLGETTQMALKQGQRIDRFGGSEVSRFFSPEGTPNFMRALPPGTSSQPLRTFEVVKPFSVESGTVAPAFNQTGLGTQFRSSMQLGELIEEGFLIEVFK